MRSIEDKEKFIIGRAEGKSFPVLNKELGLAVATCSQWEKEFKTKINELKKLRLDDLYKEYGMYRADRIKCLGKMLKRIDHSLDKIDIDNLPAEKLLDFKLKYTQALKNEYIDLQPESDLKSDFSVKDVLVCFVSLFNKIQNDNISLEQAKLEKSLLESVLKFYETTILSDKISVLETSLKDKK
jgi:hypothetical protein